MGDSDNSNRILDQSMSTAYLSANAQCWVGYDFGENLQADITQIRYAADSKESRPSEKLDGALFEGSNDNNNWVTIFEVNVGEFQPGYNTWMKEESSSHKFRYLRFRHTSQSGCFLSEIEVTGILLSAGSIPVSGCDVYVDVFGAESMILASKVHYSDSLTAIV